MKKVLLISLQFVLLSFFLLQLASCGDDDESPSSLPLEGTLWTQISFDYTNCDSPDDNQSGTLDCTDQNCITALFGNNMVTYTEVENGDTTVVTIPITITASTFSAFGLTASYQIVGNTLTASSENPRDGCTLTEVYTGGI